MADDATGRGARTTDGKGDGATATAKTKSRTTPTTTVTATASPQSVDRRDAEIVKTPDAPPTSSPPVEPSPRLDVVVSVASVDSAFRRGLRARSVALVQRVLSERGFEPGNHVGVADHATRAAYAQFQRSVDEKPTGLPTADSLDLLGFDVT